MYNDGIIGNYGIIQILGTLTAGQFNTVLPKGKQPFKLKDIIPTQYEYLYPPPTEESKKDAANQNLIKFVKSAPNAPNQLFKD